MWPAHRQLSAHGLSILILLAPLPVAAAGAAMDDATKAQLDEATEYYERGVSAFDAEKLTEALAHFQKSFDIVNSPNSRMMMGRTLAKMGKLVAAYRELAKTLRQASELASTQKKYKKTVVTVQKELDEIAGKLAFVTVKQGTSLRLGDEPVPPAEWHEPQPVMPGAVAVEVAFADGRKTQRQIALKAGERVDLQLEPPPPPRAPASLSSPNERQPRIEERSSPGLNRKTAGYVVGGVGILGVGAFVGLSLLAASSYGNPKAGCVAQLCPESGVDNEGSKSMLQGLGYAGLGVGIAGLAVGTWLLVSGDSKPQTALQVGTSGVRLVGRF